MEQAGDNPEHYRLSEADNERIFAQRIRPIEYAGLKSVGEPVVHLVGAQPGAGKSLLLGLLQEALTTASGPHSVMSVVGDDLRICHPVYRHLQETDDQQAARYTDADSARWVERAIELSWTIRSHVLLEGTLRRPEVTIATATAYREHGFTSHLHLVAVHEYVSRLRIIDRYLGQVVAGQPGRYTIRAAHDASYQVLPTALRTIIDSDQVDEVSVYNGAGELHQSADASNTQSAGSLVEVFDRRRQQPLIAKAILLQRLDHLGRLARQYQRDECQQDIAELRQDIEASR